MDVPLHRVLKAAIWIPAVFSMHALKRLPRRIFLLDRIRNTS